MNYCIQPTYAQLRRGALDQRKTDRRARFIDGQVCRPAALGARLFPHDTGLPDRVRDAVAARYDATPHDPGASIEQLAFHEAGHYVVAEACGLIATTAEIHGSRFGRYGWGGSAAAAKQPVVDGGWGYTADDVEREAMFTLAGLVAEHIFAGIGPFACEPWKRGDLYGGLGEILEGCILVARLADMTGEARAATLDVVLMRTARTLFAFSNEIEQIASCLKSKHNIFRDDRKVRHVLCSIRCAPWKSLTSLDPEQAEAVRSIITDAPTDLVHFVEEVGR